MVYSKKNIIENFKVHPTDTGSPEVQVALLTNRINYLSDHFKKNPKDFGSRDGFLKLIGQRRRLLNYLKKHNQQKYKEIIDKLNLRK
ncbi:MAG: 30S ribosomal protein S15 [Endomicrobiales bacterium]|nr:30S ribosomal protein S15 [Endomicrobiales bacterium]